MMTGRERFLTALENKKPDRLPIQVHSWMTYYLNTYLNGMDQYEAYEFFGMDPVIYETPEFIFDPADLADWEIKTTNLGTSSDGVTTYAYEVTTPSGILRYKMGENKFTSWMLEYPIKNEEDFEIWDKHIPVPVGVDWTRIIKAKERIGDKGIVRGPHYCFGQGSVWQSFANYLYGTEEAIMDVFDKPEWIHHCLESMLKKLLKVYEIGGTIEYDLIETGGGAGSSTVISPAIHKEFCLPYDKRQHEAIRAHGCKTVYHLCGGLMPLLEIVAENGADGLETMTPPAMGADCNLAEAERRVGDKLFFIGGFDQNKGFENGNPKIIKEMVRELFEACPNGGYICSPSDHFFFGDPENIHAFVAAAKECIY